MVRKVVVGFAFIAASCGKVGPPPRPEATPTKMYTFPLELPNDTLVCVVVYRPNLSEACIRLERLRRIAFDLEAD